MLNLLRQRNSRDDAAATPRKLELEEYTPLQIGEALVSQAPLRAREEVWSLIRRASPPAPRLSWLAHAVRSNSLWICACMFTVSACNRGTCSGGHFSRCTALRCSASTCHSVSED